MAAAVRRGPLPCAKTAPMTQCAMGAVWAVVYVCCTYSCYSRSMTSVLPFRHSSCVQFSVPSRAECRQVTPCRVSSASGTKTGAKKRGCEYSKRMTKRVIVFIEAYLAKRIVAGGFIGSCSCKSRGMRKRDKLKSRYWRLYLRPLEQRSLAIYQRYALGRLSACYQSCRRQGRALNRCGRRIEANEG